MANYERVISNIRETLSDYIKENKLGALVIGVSGGFDSTACCALAKPVCRHFNIPLVGRSLIIESNKSDEIERARMVGDIFCTDFIEVGLTPAYEVLKNAIEAEEKIDEDNSDYLIMRNKIRRGNIKARVRMIYLYNLAQLKSGMVLSTDNFTELMLGFWTLHGDIGDFGMIQNLKKTEAYNMIEYMISTIGKGISLMRTVLQDSIDCIPTDGLGITNSDLDQILPGWEKLFRTSRQGYAEVDRIFGDYFEKAATFKTWGNDTKENERILAEMETHPVIQRYKRTHFKRENPINISREILFK